MEEGGKGGADVDGGSREGRVMGEWGPGAGMRVVSNGGAAAVLEVEDKEGVGAGGVAEGGGYGEAPRGRHVGGGEEAEGGHAAEDGVEHVAVEGRRVG